MKKHLLFTAFFACLSMTTFARIWRVNNNIGINADFTTLSAAITAAAATGDIIYVEPSATSYDENTTITVNKQVKIIGNGAFLVGKGLQVNTNDSKFSNTNITFDVGSEGSTISGITAEGFTVNPTVNTITIQRCRMTSVLILFEHSNISILENWISGYIVSVGMGSVTNFFIKNNVVTGYIDIKTADVATIENNTIISSSYALNLNNNTTVALINNIFQSGGGAPTIVPGSSPTYSNNISSDNAIPSTNNNQINVDMTTVLATLPFTSDSDAQLKAGSPALNTGLYGNGDDIGAFSNGTGRPTFVLGLIPPYPTIYALSGATAPVTTPIMNVTISTRSNN
jgi:hypothetical protein